MDTIEQTAELWIPRTMWEKRRQLSSVISRSISIGQKILILSCDTWTTFFGRVDIPADLINDALIRGQIDYLQVTPLLESTGEPGAIRSGGPGGTDLSRVLGQIGVTYKFKHVENVIVDDVDMMIDLGSSESALASLYALLYALKSRFSEVTLFVNPLRSQREVGYLLMMDDILAIHHQPVPAQQQQETAA